MSWDDKIKATATGLADKLRPLRKSLPKRGHTGQLGGTPKTA